MIMSTEFEVGELIFRTKKKLGPASPNHEKKSESPRILIGLSGELSYGNNIDGS